MENKTEIIFVENQARQSRLATLKELLSNKFTIPFFQRPYAWNDDHFRDLLQTIRENKDENNREAFLGSIIVASENNTADRLPGNERYLLIDGQQRVTSLLMLLKFISIRLGEQIEEVKNSIREIKKLREEAKGNKDFTLFEKYINQKESEKSKKEEYEKSVKKIKKILVSDRIQREIYRSGRTESKELEQEILEYIFSGKEDFENNEIKKIKSTFDEEVDDTDGIVDFLNYILDKCIFCFLSIQGADSEDYAIDIFNSLNSTGEPLTAFEILKSLIHKKFPKNQKLSEIENDLMRKKLKKMAQNKYTDRLLLFTNMIIKELQLEKSTSFRDKKKILDRLLGLSESRIKECINSMHSLHKFILDNWENKEHPSIGDQLDIESKIIFDFLRSINHDRVLPLLYLCSRASVDINNAVKMCAAFTCLWRGYSSDGGTDRIDRKYEEMTKISCQEEVSKEKLQRIMLQQLNEREEGGMIEKKWVDKFKAIDIYKSKKLARFLLFVAFHKSCFNEKNKSLKISKLKFLTTDNWKSGDFRTIEHIVPQSYKPIHVIGNLILLPIGINAKVGKKKFSDKKEVYRQCIDNNPNDLPYVPILKEILSYDGSGDDFHLDNKSLEKRGERLGNSIWQTLFKDWLGVSSGG